MKKVELHLADNKDEQTKKMNLLEQDRIVSRIWDKDYRVWSNEPTEINNRLGWLDYPSIARNKVTEISKFVDEIIAEGFTHVLLLGMGGSSLAPEVYRKIFGVKDGYLELSVLDSTHPDQVQGMLDKFNPNKTLYIVSTKSGGTVETISFMKRFYNTTIKAVGENNVGNHFVAITDPNSGLEEMAKKLNFRKIFINDPNIGGRYSALSLFGLVPAALIGVNLNTLLDGVDLEIEESRKNVNPAAKVGTALGVLANKGVDKATFILSNNLKPFGAWVEQLVAESTGKNGKGILPVEGEKLLSSTQYSHDRVFIYIHTADDTTQLDAINKLTEANFPVIELTLNNTYELGALFFMWEMVTVIASWVIAVQPFDQPNVEEAKIIGRKMMKEYLEKGEIKKITPALEENGIKAFGDISATKISEVIPQFLQKMNDGKNGIIKRSYVAIQAYVNMSEEAETALKKLRSAIQEKYAVATTVGFGPRFLHSTGQLHKGDSGNGLFIQLVSKNINDVEIPNEAGSDKSDITFNVLLNAQALGDREALLANNRNVVRFDISENVAKDMGKLL